MKHFYTNRLYQKTVSIMIGCLFVPLSVLAKDSIESYPVQEQSLQRLFLLGLENSPAIQYALEQQSSALSNQKVVDSFLKPEVSFQSELSYAWMEKQSYARTAHQLKASYPLYQPDREDRSRIASYQASERKLQIEEAKQALWLKISNLYFNYWIEKAEQLFLQKEFESISDIMEQVKQRFTIGYQDLNDISDIQARLDSNRADLIQIEQNLRITEIDLEATLGDSIDLSKISPPPPLPSYIDLANNQSDLFSLIEQHPTLLRYEQALLASRKQVEYEKNKDGVAVQAFGIVVNNQSDGYFYDDAQGAKIGLKLNIPLYLGGKIEAAVSKARSESNQVMALKRQKELLLMASLQNAIESSQHNQKRVAALKDVLESNKQALVAAENGLSTGNRNILDLLDAQRSVHRAERDISIVNNRLWTNWHLYQWSTGRLTY
ncbi:hypothetical protein MNBD_GAMMA03-2119 [hydrothermal vent metagenome]|uniref:Heavy metal RND efflux outer membrane protein, CzcC family n=1 Tax=hydrothermal vent metagenome TaxID=652676 RepID=A0A3B0VZF8_9ZZZZ